jgi:protein-S-isoprenylcysteine O-methyltransferase Ste14
MGRSPDMILVGLHLGVSLWVAVPFVYFLTAGAKIFTVPERDSGSVLGQLSFVSGMACVLGLGFYQALLWYQVLCGAVLALCSVVLYEWTRRTVIDRNFYIALGGEVPAAVCRNGPYKFVRHPFYLSYMLAFLSMVVAFPSVVSGSVCGLNIALFVYMAFDDERVLLRSPLAADYLSYRTRARMFLPRFGRSPGSAMTRRQL